MVACLLEGMQKNAYTQVNYDKFREITQETEENTALFMACLMEAITKYTNLDLTSLAGTLFLHAQFISQSGPRHSEKAPSARSGTRDTPTGAPKCGFLSLQ
jgi:hypothetical protein